MFFKKKDLSKEQTKTQVNADKLFSQKKYQKALNEYLKLTKSMPDDIVLLNKIGDVYSKINDNQNAFKYYERVANHHASTGFLPKAIAVYKKILKLDPEHTEARECLVKLYLQKDLASEAKAELKKIADYYIESNLLTRALDTLKKLVELEPHNIQYHNQLAEILIKEGRSKDACQQFFEMAKSFVEKNMTQQAKMVVQKALNLDPEHPEILIISAQLAIEEGQFEKGISKLQKVLTQEPNHLDALIVLGKALLQHGDVERAHQCFLQVMKLDSTQTQYMENLIDFLIGERKLEPATSYLEPFADLLIQNTNQDKAITLVRNILEIDETFEPAIQLLVKIYLSVKMTPNAILALEKAANHFINLDQRDKAAPFINRILEIDPDNLEWKSQLEGIPAKSITKPFGEEQESEISLLEEDNQEENIEEISALVSGGDDLDASVIEDTSTSIKNRLTEIEILVRHGLIDNALVHLNKILEKFPDHIEANTQLRHIYLEQENPEKAASCSLVLARNFIDQKEFGKATEYLNEAEPYLPGESRKLKGIIESQENYEASLNFQDMNEDGYNPEMEASGLSYSQEDLIIAPSEEEVVRIDSSDSDMKDFDAPEMERSPSDDSVWALDIPAIGADEIQVHDDDLNDDSLVLDFQNQEVPDIPEEDSTPDDSQDEAVDEPEFEADLSPAIEPEEEAILDIPQDQDDEDEIQIPMVDDDYTGPEESEPDSSLSLEDSTNLLDLSEPEFESEPEIANLDLMTEEHQVTEMEPPSDAILGELEEIDFFISMEAYQEAQNLVLEAIEKHGPLPELLKKQEEIPSDEENEALPTAEAEEPSEEATSDLFDLASVLSDELFEEEKEVTDNSAPEEFQSVEELFEEFKKGVAEQIDESDFQTHYDLGIGYKEMGLLKEGIAEFRIAMGDINRFLDCVSMISICQKELGKTDEAIETLKAAIGTDRIDDSQRNLLRYDLAITYEANGELEKAIDTFRHIEESQPGFRDVAERIEMLI